MNPITFVITGTLSQPRAHYVDLIEAAGGKVSSNISPHTSYLVAGDKPGRNKLDKAHDLGVEIIDESDLGKLLMSSAIRMRSDKFNPVGRADRHVGALPRIGKTLWHDGRQPDFKPTASKPSTRTIYHAYWCSEHGENEAMFDSDFSLLGAWHNNDATFRDEYMNPWLKKLGIIVKSLPASRNKAAYRAMCDEMGYEYNEGDEVDHD